MKDVTTPFNLDGPPLRPAYQVFEGPRYVDTMPVLRADNRIPLTLPGLMKRRLQVLKLKEEELIDRAWDNYYNSATAILNKGNEYRIEQAPKELLEIGPKVESNLADGALPISTERWRNSADAPGFTYEEAEEAGLAICLSLAEVLKHIVWKAVAGDILQEYAPAAFKKHNFTTAMPVHLKSPQEIPNMRALTLGRGDSLRSYLGGISRLDSGTARLVGYAENLEQKIQK